MARTLLLIYELYLGANIHDSKSRNRGHFQTKPRRYTHPRIKHVMYCKNQGNAPIGCTENWPRYIHTKWKFHYNTRKFHNNSGLGTKCHVKFRLVETLPWYLTGCRLQQDHYIAGCAVIWAIQLIILVFFSARYYFSVLYFIYLGYKLGWAWGMAILAAILELIGLGLAAVTQKVE